jgi:thioredoxin reductase (NADPH)
MADDPVAFPSLDGSQLAALEALGARRRVAAGEYLYREGDASYDFYVILSGAAEIFVRADGEERTIARHGPGLFLGELNLLTGQRVFVSARVVEPGEVIVVPVAILRQLLNTNPALGDMILAALLARRSFLLTGAAQAIRVVGSRFSPPSREVREFLTRYRIPHEWLDADRHGAVEGLLRESDVAPSDLPVVIVSGKVMRRATPGDVASYLGLTLESIPERSFDLVVVGAGPAGLAAAVYGASEGLNTLVVDLLGIGGQAGTSSRIENYLGFPTAIAGGELAERAFVQAEKFGARFTSPCTAVSLREQGGHLVLHLSDGSDVAGRAVIVASGASYRRLAVARLEEFEGADCVHYAATEHEARSLAGSPVVVVGGGNSAGQAAVVLAGCCSKVTLVCRSDDLRKSMSRYLVDRLEANQRVEVRTRAEVVGVDGEESLAAVRIRGPAGEEALHCAALFSFIGADPATKWLTSCAVLDERGFVLTDRSLDTNSLDARWQAMGRQPLPYETSRPGLFAAGDVRAGSIKRVAAAVGEGAAAVRSVHEYLAFAH